MSRAFKWIFLGLVAAFFAVPMLGMARFAFQAIPVALLTPERTLEGWSLAPALSLLANPEVLSGAKTSLVLVLLSIVVTLVILVPLAVMTEIAAPQLRPAVTTLTLLPWVVPPIALVVGVAATFRGQAPWFLASPLSLVPFYALWAMPFTYRALDAGLRSISARTLYEASRSLGASTGSTILRVLLPNMATSVAVAAALTAAMVLGEFAFASLLLKETLPTVMVNLQRSDPRAGLALALIVLVLTAALIAVIVRVVRKKGLQIQTAGI